MQPFVVLASLSASAAATGICPFLGPVFPAARSLATDAAFQATIRGLGAGLQEALSTGNSSFGSLNPNDTYSVQVFSTRDEKPLLDFHRRGIDVVGSRVIDGDSVYRIASTTKLITVYLLLLHAGDDILGHSVTRYLPELAQGPHWPEVTIGSLAGYMSGVASEPYGIDALGGGIASGFLDAFPPLEPHERPPCQYGSSGCSRKVFLDHIITRRPVYLPNSTPAYTNTAFALLGLVLESATGLSYEANLRELLVDPLRLTGTTAETPKDASKGVIVGDEIKVGWNFTIDGPGIGMGAVFSSPNDMAKIGRAVLSSSLLPGNTTRAWMKPTSFTSSLIGAVGRPWEIYRSTFGPNDYHRVVDLYTKAGNFGGYGSKLVLIPAFDVGFVVMMAGAVGTIADTIATIVVDTLLPALEEAARQEASAAFAGTYGASDGLNSSISLTSAKGVSGLGIESWISNSTDMLRDVFRAPQYFQMYPSNVVEDGAKKISWRSSYVSLPDNGVFSACPSWVALDRPNHGIYGLDEFVFDLDDNGRASAVEPKALKIRLARN